MKFLFTAPTRYSVRLSDKEIKKLFKGRRIHKVLKKQLTVGQQKTRAIQHLGPNDVVGFDIEHEGYPRDYGISRARTRVLFHVFPKVSMFVQMQPDLVRIAWVGKNAPFKAGEIYSRFVPRKREPAASRLRQTLAVIQSVYQAASADAMADFKKLTGSPSYHASIPRIEFYPARYVDDEDAAAEVKRCVHEFKRVFPGTTTYKLKDGHGKGLSCRVSKNSLVKLYAVWHQFKPEIVFSSGGNRNSAESRFLRDLRHALALERLDAIETIVRFAVAPFVEALWKIQARVEHEPPDLKSAFYEKLRLIDERGSARARVAGSNRRSAGRALDLLDLMVDGQVITTDEVRDLKAQHQLKLLVEMGLVQGFFWGTGRKRRRFRLADPWAWWGCDGEARRCLEYHLAAANLAATTSTPSKSRRSVRRSVR